MKKLITLFLLVLTTLSYGQVYFDYPSDGSSFASGSNGLASFNYHILTVSYYYATDYYGTNVQQPNGSWTGWQGGQTGGWGFEKAGTYHLKAGVHVVMDLGGSSNYWMYRTITIYITDTTPPAQPSGLSVGANPGDSYVRLSWSANSEYDIDSYEVQRKVYDSQWYDIGTTSNNYYVDPEWYYYFSESTIHVYYRIRAKDINGNYSSYSSSVGCWPYNAKISADNNTNNANTISLKYDISNYPNPFNPTTRISYSLADAGFVTLKVYDILGREVATLVNEKKQAGKYEIEFDASQLPSGTYVYRLIAGNYQMTKKMQFVK